VATSLLLVGTWVGKEWDQLSIKRRGPRRRGVHEELQPYKRLLAMLRYVLKKECGFRLAIEVPRRRGQLAHRGGDLRTTESRL
jgi:hypothetical protein